MGIVMSGEREKPLVIFDGDCGFCRKSVEGWRASTGERVAYAPYQELAGQFPEVPIGEFKNAVQFIDVDGRRYGGAEAVFRVMAYVPGKRWWLTLYRGVPGFGAISRRAYAWVANNRRLMSSLSWWLWGNHVGPSTFVLARRLFLRLLGLIYFIAFVSFWVQAKGLVGEHGILPVGEFLKFVHERYGQTPSPSEAYWKFPTLCWWNSSDWFLTWGLCGIGTLCSVLLMLGLLPTLMLIVLWIFYLSVVVAGQTFMSFQWDILLLEAGFAAIFYAPLAWRLGCKRANAPSGAIHFLLVWLLFRLMFESGLVKLTAFDVDGSNTWRNLTALKYHYETQPLPTWTAWYAHHLPSWFHKTSVALTFFVELVAPVLLFAPRRIRHAACAAIIGLMALIGGTGNYNFFNFLTVVLCVALFDDALLKPFFPKRAREVLLAERPWRPRYIRRSFLALLTAFIVLYSALDGLQSSAGRRGKPSSKWLTEAPKWVEGVQDKVRPFRSINSYGLFRVMTRERDEIIIEGSDDGRTWKEYEFKWKPGDVTRAPRFVQPHQPRLDWQMWFAALGNYEHQYWFRSFLSKVRQGEPAVLGLLGSNPFPDQPPRYVRAKLYKYEFTDKNDPPTDWWKREYVRPYSPVLSGKR